MRYKWWFLGILTAVTVLSFITVFLVGLDFGIDFVGGVRMEVSLEQDSSVDDVRSVVSDAGVEAPVVQSVTGTSGADSYMITAEEMSEEQQDTIIAELDSRHGVVEGSVATETVGASFGQETANRAYIAIAIAILAIIGYLSFRFEIKFALPAIFALIHDLALVLAIYAATGRLVTYATVAAILTILGYSVHDTIVIFDRMRENTQLMKPRDTYSDMVDLSITQTMVRSINTSVALLLPLLAILIFGGPTLNDFAFALTIGVVTGTYSSFFVAAPLVVLWKEREPRYRKRLAVAGMEGQVVVNSTEAGQLIGEPATVAPGAVTQAPTPSAGVQAAVQPRAPKASSTKKAKSKRPPAKGKKPTAS
jgi:SecD/SecF fusion protein